MNHNPEYKYQAAFFTIRTLTNLHAGSGSENYGIVDNLIQRDQATNFPCINSSSLKGALREFFKQYLKEDEQLIAHVFGQEKHDETSLGQNEDNKTQGESSKKVKKKITNQAGKYRFLQADLLSLPVRSDVQPYFNTTGSWLVDHLKNQLRLLKGGDQDNWDSIDPLIEPAETGHHFVDGTDLVALDGLTEEIGKSKTPISSEVKNIFGNQLAIVKMQEFVELVSDYQLPVIARNKLNDGQSENLWYEQVLPRESRLFFSVLYPEGDPYFQQFKESVQQFPVQIGANASVGYGFCEIKELMATKKTTNEAK